MADTSKEKERMDEAIKRSQKEVADEVSEHQADDRDLENVSGGVSSDQETLWEVGVIYKT